MIRFHCTCKHPFDTEDNMAGGLVQCPACGKLNDIPSLSDLAVISEDGTYKIDRTTDEEEINRLVELQRAFARQRVDRHGAEIDLRPTMQDIDSAGADEVPLELKDEIRPGAPKYDPVTGERLRPMDLKARTSADSAIPAIPVGAKTLKYASADVNVVNSGWRIFVELFKLPNLVVMLCVFITHIFLQMLSLAPAMMWIFLLPMIFVTLLLLIAHYANTIDETGPDARDELPRPLRNVSWYDDMWGPFINVMLAFLCAYGIGLLCLLVSIPIEVRLALLATLSIAGTLAFPAILLTTTTSGSVLNLRPDRVWGVIRACGFAYVFMLFGWLGALGLYLGTMIGVDLALMPLFAPPSAAPLTWLQIMFHWAIQYPLMCVAIYLMHAYAWYLGLQYRKHHADFPWVLQSYSGRTGAGQPPPRQGFTVLPKVDEVAARVRQPKAPAKSVSHVQPKPVQALPQPPENAEGL